jgi:hypothetical protein
MEANNKIPHGLVSLPINIRAIHNHNSIIRGNVKISNAVNIIKNKGGGVLFGMFCRGTPGVIKTKNGQKTLLQKKVILKGNNVNNGTIYKEIMNIRHIIKNKTIKPAKHKYKRKTIYSSVLNYGNF